MTIIVNSFYGESFFVRREHIFNKVKETKPSFTKLYSSVSVAFVSLVGKIIASINHAPVNTVKGVVPFSMLGNNFFVSATTTCRVAIDNIINTYVFGRASAIALAKRIIAICASEFTSFYNCKFVKFLSWLIGRRFPINKLFFQ